MLMEFEGIVGDAKGGVGKRQLNIMAAETLAELRAEGFKTEPGAMGEQIVVAGIDLATVTIGSRWRIGSAVVEVMGGAAQLCVPLEVNLTVGSSWAAAKG